MTSFLLDTDTVSHALRGERGVDEHLSRLDPGDWAISSVTRGELRYGLALRPGANDLARLVEAFLATARCLPWDAAAADRYGAVRARLRAAGTPIGPLDEMIAAHALALDAVLVTANERHFKQVAGLRSENWRARSAAGE